MIVCVAPSVKKMCDEKMKEKKDDEDEKNATFAPTFEFDFRESKNTFL